MKRKSVFEQAARKRYNRFPRNAVVLTWSDEVRGFLNELAQERRLPKPELVHLNDGAAYDYTFSLKAEDVLGRKDCLRLRSFAASLLNFSPWRARLLFTGLVPQAAPNSLLHVFFALLRDAIARRTRKPFSALYAPLGTTGRYAGEFRLHADLYLPRILFNVFNDVSEDGAGASTFLKVRDFLKVLRQCEALPSHSAAEIKTLFTGELRADGYEQFIRLVHDSANAWCSELWDRMEKVQEVIPMRRGEGYMIHDRLWLHGRTDPARKVTRFRVHRLVFDPRPVPAGMQT